MRVAAGLASALMLASKRVVLVICLAYIYAIYFGK